MTSQKYPKAINDAWKLREWRKAEKLSLKVMANHLNMSASNYYLIESGSYVPPYFRCNAIVELTQGAVRYRDLIPDFMPEYA